MPKHTELIARALILSHRRILLCQSLPRRYFYLPGGHVEFNESAPRALARELKEEANLRAKIGRLALVSEHSFKTKGKRHHELNLVFHVELSSPPREIESREKDIAFAWVRISELAEVDLRPRAVRSWVINSGAAGRKVEWISDTD